MGWPLSQDYNEAIQDLATSFGDPELRGGEAVVNALGLPMPCSGNFADVYQVKCPATRRTWAVKCFTRQIPGLQERYQQVSLYLGQVKLPFMVGFTFLDHGIRVRGDWYPVLKMQWVEGHSLNTFVKDNLDRPQVLKTLCQIWLKLARRLREADMAHCDLQHGNVLLVPGGKAGTLGVRLVDYDGMCVPALTLLKSIELGHPSFQHPQRLREGTYGLEVDRFSHLVIYTALRALAVAGRPLWDKYDNGDNLLFRPPDFEAPQQSAVFAELLQLNDPAVRELAGQLAEAARQPLERTPLLADLVPEAPAVTVPAASPTSTAPAESAFASLAEAGDVRPARRGAARRKAKFPVWVWAAGGVALLALVVGGVVLATGRKKPPEAPAPQAQAVAQANPGPTPWIPEKPGMPKSQPKMTDTGAPPPKSEPRTPAGAGERPRPPEVASSPPDHKPELSVQPVVPDVGGEHKVGEIRRFDVAAAPAESVAFSPDLRRALVADPEHVIHLWDLGANKEIRRLAGHTKPVESMAVSPDGRRALSGGDDHTLRLWDLENGQELQRLGQETMGFGYVSFSPDGRRALAGGAGADRAVYLWDVENGQEVRRFTAETGRVRKGKGGRRTSAFSPDRRHALSGAADYTLRLWELDSGQEVRKLTGHEHGVECLAFSPDGRHALSGSLDGTLVLWDVDAGTELRRFEGHTAGLRALAFSPDGHRALSGGADLIIRLWDVDAGKELCRLEGHGATVLRAAFSTDGSQAISGSADGTVRVWRLPPVVR